MNFSKPNPYKPRNEKEKFLIRAFSSLKDESEIANFLRDLLTPAEIKEFANRLEIVKLLHKGDSYLEIAKKIGVSTTTVTRVSQWLFSGCGGYKIVLERLLKKKL